MYLFHSTMKKMIFQRRRHRSECKSSSYTLYSWWILTNFCLVTKCSLAEYLSATKLIPEANIFPQQFEYPKNILECRCTCYWKVYLLQFPILIFYTKKYNPQNSRTEIHFSNCFQMLINLTTIDISSFICACHPFRII